MSKPTGIPARKNSKRKRKNKHIYIYMEEYFKYDETRIAKLKQIWKTITPKNIKRL